MKKPIHEGNRFVIAQATWGILKNKKNWWVCYAKTNEPLCSTWNCSKSDAQMICDALNYYFQNHEDMKR